MRISAQHAHHAGFSVFRPFRAWMVSPGQPTLRTGCRTQVPAMLPGLVRPVLRGIEVQTGHSERQVVSGDSQRPMHVQAQA